MARKNANSVGRPFVATQVVAFGVTNFDALQSGQWVRFGGDKRPVRFVRERITGETFIVPRPKGGRLSLAAFRLACGVQNRNVVPEVK